MSVRDKMCFADGFALGLFVANIIYWACFALFG